MKNVFSLNFRTSSKAFSILFLDFFFLNISHKSNIVEKDTKQNKTKQKPMLL